jgi:lipopolysaccharide/colanic/teichoic acid biosynthesis glycosyltransferase
LKRIFEIIISMFCLILFSPLLILVLLSIIIFDSRPVFFRQIRVGILGHDFLLNKFRTMSLTQKTAGGTFDAGDKSRITPIGSFLRKTKLDELPQLWNVLIGNMSIVGPRPEVRKWVDAYPERWAKVLTVKPGITDPASIYYRNEEELLAKADDPEAYYRNHILPHKLDLYEEYVRTRSFTGDICLILKTIISILFPTWYSCHQDSA